MSLFRPFNFGRKEAPASPEPMKADGKLTEGELRSAEALIQANKTRIRELARGKMHQMIQQDYRTANEQFITEQWENLINIQSALSALGQPVGRADGVFGPATFQSIVGFQLSQGLTTSGRIDKAFLRQLKGALKNQTKEVGKTPQLAQNFGSWITRNFINRGKNSCGASVGDALIKFGMRGVPTSGRNGANWTSILENKVASGQFKKERISHPSQARAGGFLVYWAGKAPGRTPAGAKYGHIETKWADGRYYHYTAANHPGGSDRNCQTFTGYVYYPVRLNA